MRTPIPSSPPGAHWLNERRLRVYPRVMLAMFIAAVPLYALTFEGGLDGKGRPMGTDFIAFWSAARVTARDLGVDPWNLRELGRFQLETFPGLSGPTPWVYPPTMLLLVLPLGFLTFAPAFVAWTSFGLTVFLGSLWRVIRAQRHAWPPVLAFPVVLAFPGLWLGIAQGQTQFVIATLMAVALTLLDRNPRLAGVAIGLMAIKPHLAILFPLLLVATGQWRAFLYAAVTAVSGFGVAVLAFGLSSIRSWFDGMSLIGGAIDSGALPVYKFVTPYTSLRLLGLPEVASLILHVLIAMPVCWVVWTLWRNSDDLRVRGSALVVGTFLVTPYAADYDLAVLAFPVAWMAMLGLEDGWLRADRNLLVATWVLPWLTAPIAALTHVGLSPLVLVLLLRQLWWRVNDSPHLHLHPATGRPIGTT